MRNKPAEVSHLLHKISPLTSAFPWQACLLLSHQLSSVLHLCLGSGAPHLRKTGFLREKTLYNEQQVHMWSITDPTGRREWVDEEDKKDLSWGEETGYDALALYTHTLAAGPSKP